MERAAQEIEGQRRSFFLGLEDRLGRTLDAKERIVAFSPEYAACWHMSGYKIRSHWFWVWSLERRLHT